MKRTLTILVVLLAALAISGCSAQSALNSAKAICRDGVEYLSYERFAAAGDYSFSIVPHLKPDGSLYTCGGDA